MSRNDRVVEKGVLIVRAGLMSDYENSKMKQWQSSAEQMNDSVEQAWGMAQFIKIEEWHDGAA